MSETSRMPWIAKALSGATIGALLAMYVSDTFFNSRAYWIILIGVVLGAVAGILLLGR